MPESSHPNFLTQPAMPALPPPQEKPRRRGLMAVGIVIFVLLVLGVLVAPAMYGGYRAGTAAYRVGNALQTAQADLMARQFVEADGQLAIAEQNLLEVRAGLKATGLWRSAPYLGSKIRALEDVERAGSATIGGLRDLLAAAIAIQEALNVPASAGGLGVAPSRSYNDLTKEEKRAVVARLAESLPRLRTAREKVLIALDAWKRVPQNELFGSIRDRLAPLVEKLPAASRQLDEAVSMLEIAIPILGYPTPKTYLVLLQNADELRPGGGFIGNVGLMSVDAGDLSHIVFEDVYAVDDPVASTWKDVPPPILQRELGVRAWFLRDSNWSPDFPESAARILDVFTREMKQGRNIDVHPDGVIALEPDLFRRLLLLTGPLSVGGKTFTADNFFDQLQYDVEQGFLQNGIPVRQRKDIVAKVGDELIKQLTSQPASRWPSMLDILANALNEKNMMVFAHNRDEQALIDGRGWGGRTLGATGDELWVVDANLAALKTDGVMDKQIFYSIDATNPDGPTATVRLQYKNTNTKIDWRYTRYRSYTRVYVPEGSELLSWTGTGNRNPDVMRELGKQVYGAFWVVEPGRTGELSFTYRLPARVTAGLTPGPYTLLVQRQPGSNTKLTLDLRFGKTLKRATPGEASQDFGDDRYRYSADLTKNEAFTIEF